MRFLTLIALSAAILAVEDPFTPYQADSAPAILRELPASGPPPPAGVEIRRLVIRSLDVPVSGGMRTNEVFTVVAMPTTPGPHPGIVLLHGGSGNADAAQAAAWAARGYVAAAPDLPGIGNPKTCVDSAGAWRDGAYAAGRWTIGDDPRANTIVQAQVAALQCVALLRCDARVDRNRVGVFGISWGGYSATMMAGLCGKRIRAAFSTYGSGDYANCTFSGQLAKGQDPAAQERWYALLDAARRAPGIAAPIFFAAASNDHYFWPPAVMNTLAAVPAGLGNHAFAANANHRLGGLAGGAAVGLLGPAIAVHWFDHHLRGVGRPFPRLRVVKAPDAAARRLHVVAEPAEGIARVTVWSSPSGKVWEKRSWSAIEAERGADGIWSAALPDAPGGDGHAFATAADDRPISVSSILVPIPARR